MFLKQGIQFMKKTHISFILLFLTLGILQTKSQITSTSSNLVAQPVPDRTVLYNTSDAGVAKPIIWGLDLAWLSVSRSGNAPTAPPARESAGSAHPAIGGHRPSAGE